MKKAVASKSLASEIPGRVVDQSAETIGELVEATGQGRYWVSDYARKQISLGKWERVWKKSGSKTVPAYRRKA